MRRDRFASIAGWAPVLLAFSVVGRLVYTFGRPGGTDLVDLRVYTYGSAALARGSLYAFTFGDMTPGFDLPFTYPPFAAMVLFPLHWVQSFTVLAVAWQLGTVVALWGVVVLSLRLLLGAAARGAPWPALAMVWTAVGVWLEPVRTTLSFGQINLFLVMGVLAAVHARRWWWAGALVGLLAGIKLTPAITGLYLLSRRKFRATAFSAAVFAATVAVSFVVVPTAAAAYYGGIGSDAGRIGPVGSVINQSLRGTLSRFTGYDVGWSAVWLVAVALVTVLAVTAWLRLGRDDRLGVLVVVQLLGLLVSPISWSHHWVWFIPALVWLVHGPLRHRVAAMVLAVGLTALLASDLIGRLLVAQPSIWDFGRPVSLAIAGSVYPVAAVAILALMTWRPRAIPRVEASRGAVAPAATLRTEPANS